MLEHPPSPTADDAILAIITVRDTYGNAFTDNVESSLRVEVSQLVDGQPATSVGVLLPVADTSG